MVVVSDAFRCSIWGLCLFGLKEERLHGCYAKLKLSICHYFRTKGIIKFQSRLIMIRVIWSDNLWLVVALLLCVVIISMIPLDSQPAAAILRLESVDFI